MAPTHDFFSALGCAPAAMLAAQAGFCGGCGVEPANVLTVKDESMPADAGSCGADRPDCDAALDDSPPDATCPCIPGVKVACFESSGPSTAACVGFYGVKRCRADGTWEPCSAITTIDDLTGAACTLVRVECGLPIMMNGTSGDCSDVFRCPSQPDALE